AADLLVLPSDGSETWGLVVNEAMACGLPALVSDQVGCAPDLIIPDQTGTTFPHGDVSALVAQLLTYIEQPIRLIENKTAAVRHIQRYSIPLAAERTAAAVAQVVPTTRD
ncbi:MAG: glycosyltransferase, partial [Oscillochloridaceae bacterium umkhey_bin13]